MASAYAKKLAAKAVNQHKSYEFIHEGEPRLAAQIERYWTELGFTFLGVKTAWSAVFVSWCVKDTVASAAEFKLAIAHSIFVHWAILNETNQIGLFHALDFAPYAPAMVDIINKNRKVHTYDYKFARTHKNYESHTAVVVETGEDEQGKYALTIGGNEGDAIRRKIVRLKENGLIKQRELTPISQ